MHRLFVVGILCQMLDLTSGVTLTLSNNAVRNQDFQIFINSGTITNPVILNKPDGTEEGRCLAPLGGIPGSCSSNFAQSGTVTTVNISSVSRATNEGEWTGVHGGNSGTINITVLTVPTALTEQSSVGNFEVASSTSETFTVGMACVYPSAQIDWEFVTEASTSTRGGLTRGTCTNNGPTGGSCTDPAASSFSCDFVVTKALTDSLPEGRYKLKANLYIDGQYTSTGVSLELSTIIIIKGTTTPLPTPTPRPCQCSWLPCGWKCYYMYIIIVAVVLLVCLVVGLCCCYRRGYFGMGSKKENSRENSHVNKAYTSDTENGQPVRSSGGHREQTLL